MSSIHDLIQDEMERNGPSQVADNLLAACPDPECSECARVICPHGDMMHFHHDGCPSCAEDDGEDMSTAEQTAREAVAQFGADDGQPDEAQEWHDFDPEC
jgi:hypothetical protein